MMKRTLILAALLLVCSASYGAKKSKAVDTHVAPAKESLWVLDKENNPSDVYRHDPDLKVYYVYPDRKLRKNEKLPAVVFFFGGGWTSGDVSAFQSQAKEMANMGMVAVLADYRVRSRYGNMPDACVSDAKSAMRYVRANAARLHIDPKRICASGGSSGGHLAAAVAFCPGFDSPADDLSVSCVPQALVLFNPAICFAEAPDGIAQQLMSPWYPAISPSDNVYPQAPPTLILVGENDTTCPPSQDLAFQQKMEAAGNRCEVEIYPDGVHSFFHYGSSLKLQKAHPDAAFYYTATLERMKDFLRSLRWIQ